VPVLLVITARPEFQQAWGGQQHMTMLTLNRLAERAGAAPAGIPAISANVSSSPAESQRLCEYRIAKR